MALYTKIYASYSMNLNFKNDLKIVCPSKIMRPGEERENMNERMTREFGFGMHRAL